MKKVLLAPALGLLLIFMFTSFSFARSGCCSHHGGVCGCGCCDGTGLSSTCEPYYPECSRPVYIAPVAASSPISIIQPTESPATEPSPKVTNSPISTVIPEVKGITMEKKDNSAVGWVVLIGVTTGLVAIYKKVNRSS